MSALMPLPAWRGVPVPKGEARAATLAVQQYPTSAPSRVGRIGAAALKRASIGERAAHTALRTAPRSGTAAAHAHVHFRWLQRACAHACMHTSARNHASLTPQGPEDVRSGFDDDDGTDSHSLHPCPHLCRDWRAAIAPVQFDERFQASLSRHRRTLRRRRLCAQHRRLAVRGCIDTNEYTRARASTHMRAHL